MRELHEVLLTFSPAMGEIINTIGIFILLSIYIFGSFFRKLHRSKLLPADSNEEPVTKLIYKIAKISVCITIFFSIYQTNILHKNDGFSLIKDPNIRDATFSGLFMSDSFIQMVKIIILLWAFLFIEITSRSKFKKLNAEEIIFLLFAVLGAMLAISADDFILLFVGLEILSISLAIMTKLDDNLNLDFPFKIFMTYWLGTGLLLLGIALMYGHSGTADYSIIVSRFVTEKPTLLNSIPLPFLPLFLIFFGIFAKMLFLPFQGLAINISEKSSFHIFLLHNFLPRFTGLMIVIRLFAIFNLSELNFFLLIIGIIAALLGFLNAVSQNKISNILSCDALGNYGLLLISFASSYINVVPSIFYFCIIDALIMLIFFCTVVYINNYGRTVVTLNDLYFIKYESPISAITLGFATICLIGLPPFLGFIPIVMLAQNLISDGAYIALFFIFTLKIVSICNGVKIINSIFSKNTYDQLPKFNLQKQKSIKALYLLIVIILSGVLLIIVKSDYVVNSLIVTESTLRCYGAIGFFAH